MVGVSFIGTIPLHWVAISHILLMVQSIVDLVTWFARSQQKRKGTSQQPRVNSYITPIQKALTISFNFDGRFRRGSWRTISSFHFPSCWRKEAISKIIGFHLFGRSRSILNAILPSTNLFQRSVPHFTGWSDWFLSAKQFRATLDPHGRKF